MPLATALDSLSELLRKHTGAEVEIARPDQSDAAIVIWPWRVSESELTALRNTAPRSAEGRRAAPTVQHEIRALVFANPPLTADGLALLAKLRQALRAHPLRQAGEFRIMISFDDLPVELLASVFGAAQLPLAPCAGIALRIE